MTQTHITAIGGEPITWPRPADAEPMVLIFISQYCPIANGYAPEINRLVAEYTDDGVSFVLVHPEQTIQPASAKQHAADYGHTCPILIDTEHQLVKATGVTITPEAALITGGGTIAYRGRIDDRYAAIGVKRTVPRQTELRDAIDAVLAGRPVRVDRTEAVGCHIEAALNE